jgi:hypothetical protein
MKISESRKKKKEVKIWKPKENKTHQGKLAKTLGSFQAVVVLMCPSHFSQTMP